jgi:hypothetical protein
LVRLKVHVKHAGNQIVTLPVFFGVVLRVVAKKLGSVPNILLIKFFLILFVLAIGTYAHFIFTTNFCVHAFSDL